MAITNQIEYAIEAVPHRDRIASGMRWTLWLSLLAAPFSYGTSIVLARAGPEVIATYGLLLVYIGVSSSLLYFGGDPITIRFIPLLPVEKRFPFVVSYFAIVCATLVPWLLVVTIWPACLHYVFGESGGSAFHLLIVYLAPIYIARMVANAALAAVLEIQWAQVLNRVLTVGTFLIYTVLYVWFLPFLKQHPNGLVWGVYLGLIGLTLIMALVRLSRLKEWRSNRRSLRFFLPDGFWKYALALQQISGLGFFMNRLDMLLVLNYGGLVLFGKYVAIATFASVSVIMNRLFLDTLLPALTNLLAERQFRAASTVFSMNLRIIFAVDMAITCGVMFLIEPAMRLLGKQYADEKTLFVLMVLLYGLSGPGTAGGTLLTSAGKQQKSVWVILFQIALMVTLFVQLWPRLGLLGAVLATGGSQVVAQILLLVTARFCGPISFAMAREYAAFLVVGGAAGWIAIRCSGLGIVVGMLSAGAATGAFFVLAGYRWAELRELLTWVLPAAVGDKTGSGAEMPCVKGIC